MTAAEEDEERCFNCNAHKNVIFYPHMESLLKIGIPIFGAIFLSWVVFPCPYCAFDEYWRMKE